MQVAVQRSLLFVHLQVLLPTVDIHDVLLWFPVNIHFIADHRGVLDSSQRFIPVGEALHVGVHRIRQEEEVVGFRNRGQVIKGTVTVQAGIAEGELGGDFTLTPICLPSGIARLPDQTQRKIGLEFERIPKIREDACTDELTREPKAGTTKVVKRIDRERVQVKIEIIPGVNAFLDKRTIIIDVGVLLGVENRVLRKVL